MMMMMRLILIACTTAASFAQNTTRVMLDSIARMVDGSLAGIDDDFFNELVVCMSQPKDLMAAQDAAWAGFESYYLTNGTDTDSWGSCTVEAGCKQYKESNLTALDVGGIGIYEPCNSASNLAYYHTALGVCRHESWAMAQGPRDAMVQAYIHLAMGSFFWHGSHTFLGNVADNRLIDVLSFVAYQVSIQAFLPDPSSGGNSTAFAVLRDLNTTLRSASAVDSTNALTQMFIVQDVSQWQHYIENLDMPNYYLTFAALVCNVLNVLIPAEAVDTAIDALASVFGLPEVYYEFMTHQYLPALRSATSEKGIALSSLEKTAMGLKFGGTLVKIFYAFLWQEWVLTFGPNDELLLRPRVNKLGATLMPGVNALANMLTGYQHTEPGVQDCENVYPGDQRCRIQESHAKWHEENGNGLLDLMFVSDDMLSVTSSSAKRAARYRSAGGAKLRGTVANKQYDSAIAAAQKEKGEEQGRAAAAAAAANMVAADTGAPAVAAHWGHGSFGRGTGFKNFATKMVGGYQNYLTTVLGLQ